MLFKYSDNLPIEIKLRYKKEMNLIELNIDDCPRGTSNNEPTKEPDVR